MQLLASKRIGSQIPSAGYDTSEVIKYNSLKCIDVVFWKDFK
jgi:hypothetical protein